MSDSSRPQSDEAPPPEVVGNWLTAIADALDSRTMLCKRIAAYARMEGFDCDWQQVNRNLRWFKLWYHGGLADGYLMHRTGVKRKAPDISHWSE